MSEQEGANARASTGIVGLDEVLSGGLQRRRLYLLEGKPGSGKTTIALQCLMAAAARGERVIYMTLSETREELLSSAVSHGWTLPERMEVFELLPPENVLDEGQQQSLLYSADLELGESTERIFAEVDRLNPSMVVLDSLSEIRLLAQGSLRYRRQVLSIKHYFAARGITVLLLDDMTVEGDDKTVHSIAHGVILLEELAPEYGAERRRLRVVKYRGTSYRGGFHDFTIKAGGVVVFPRLRSVEHRTMFRRSVSSSGNAELDLLCGGGLEVGSSALVLGPAGSGKSILAISFAAAAVSRGENATLFLFDEELGLLHHRMHGLGIDLAALEATGRLHIEQVDAAELTPGEFTHRVCGNVERHRSSIVVVDSLNGYQASMPEEQFLTLHIHELLQYLNRQGVSTILTVAQHGLVGEMRAPVDVTYLADTVILMRYFEALGRVRRAISVVKKRGGQHEDSIREYRFGADGMTLGPPLTGFQGILRGVPTFVGKGEGLLEMPP
ncbi:MAG TPA: ATPase domain-containing protein [Caldimonas sp.]|jgi:circadian clock protein KaiC|nr:ATPase domain-containing protein [Caldimonas sp.]HEX2539972.1 ATPase domain-containing protein [Caldimonas sp.]